ncbi:hypothetical protein EON65_43270 [archaeon]|nr:MAG: hypothetical protein EON65_43270 [archaeon]
MVELIMSEVHAESPWDKASFFNKWTFSVINDTLKLGMERTLDFPDLMDFPHKDKAQNLKERLKTLYFDGREKKHWVATYFPFIPHLLICLLRLSWVECLIATFYTVLEGLIRISLPLILIFLLRALEAQNVNQAFLWAGILSVVSFSQTAIHHVLFFFSMRAGWNWKIACTALIYEGLFELQYGGALAATMTGRMMNLISNDVARFEEFAVVSADKVCVCIVLY